MTKHKDIIALEVNHKTFSSSSTLGGIVLRDRPAELELPMFIAMDPPKHDVQRKVVQPIVSPDNLANFEGLIRSRVRDILDDLPRGETFNWVDKVSIELTCQMLATLFDFPFEDRRKLTLLVGRRDGHPRPGRPDRKRRAARGDIPRVPRLFHAAVERARQRRAAPRPHLDAGAWRRDAQHEPARISGQPHPADRRRQRHDAQLDDRRPPVR